MSDPTTEEITAFARSVLQSQPFSRLVGTTLEDCGAGHATLSLPIADEVKQQHGFVHGGVLSYLADNALTFAGGLGLGGDALTAEFKINYVKPAQGARLVARAEALSIGKRQAVCRCDVFSVGEDGSETLCALAQGTIVAAGR